MGQYEEAASEVCRTRFERREQASFDREPHLLKVCNDGVSTEVDVSFDVLEETPFRVAFHDDPSNLRPEVARIILALPVPREGKWLTRITASDEMNLAAPWPAVEGGNIVPDRRVIQGFVRHPCHEGGCRIGFPLDVTNSAISGFCDMDAELQSANAGAEGNATQFFTI